MLKNKNFYPFYFLLALLLGIIIDQVLLKKPNSVISKENKINEILQYIKNDYVDSIDIKDIQELAIEDMLTKLDPHSVYISSEAFHSANDPLLGKFEGIGIQFRMVKDTVVVILPLENGPSKKAGIMSGDRIVIAGNDTLANKNYNSFDIQKHLKGERGSQINLWIKRKGSKDLMSFNIKRAAIPTYSIDAKFMINDSVGYIKLSSFSASTIEEFSESINYLIHLGMQNLILDLRGNTGGFLGAAIYIADQFLENGRQIVYTEGRNRAKEKYIATSHTAFPTGGLIILIDQNSASASEIVAGAIQDNDRGLIVGKRSFGKGLVQEQMPFNDGSAVRLTVARYYTPSGRSIQRSYVQGTENYYNEYYKRIHSIPSLEQDSLLLSDSLKYKTTKGRIVYGGGGIWPDHLISSDTSINFSFYNRLLDQSIIYQFAFDYVDNNRIKLNRFKSVEDYIQNFREDEIIYSQLSNLPEVKALSPSKKDLEDSKKYILTLLNAEIVRNLFENGFYQVFLLNDNFIEESLKLF